VTWVLILIHLALGFVTIVFALDEGFADGKVAFASDAWRVALGAAGAFLAYRAARALVRTINRATIDLGPDHYRRARINGMLLELIGAGFLIASWSEDLSANSVAFSSWAKPVYIGGGILLVLTGWVQWLKPGAARQPGSSPSPFPDAPQYPSTHE
jgi:hypothetical protein